MSYNNNVWRFIEDDFNKYKTPEIKGKIIQYTLDMDYVGSYNSVPEIVDRYGFDTSALYKSLNHGKAHMDYIWQYEDAINNKPTLQRRKFKNSICVYDLNNKLINKFPSVRQCEIFYNICCHRITKCCKGKIDSINNLIFRYDELLVDKLK